MRSLILLSTVIVSATKAEHPELKTLANQIIKEQEAEIKMMIEWKAKWGNK